MTTMTFRSKHVALNDIYLVVLTIYLHNNNNNYWWFVTLMSKVVSEDGQGSYASQYQCSKRKVFLRCLTH